MISLRWGQVHGWRLAQHHLMQRASRGQLLEVVSHIGGVQAQLMSAAELALAARVDGLAPTDVQSALWRERRLLRTWAMRGTLHLLAASDFPLYIAARSDQLARLRRPPSYYRYHGVTPIELNAIVETVPNTLTDVPMTREQLAEAVAKEAGKPHLREVLLSGWGALLKPSALRGDLCFGPNQGPNVTFVRPSRWIGDWQPADGQSALKEMARRYLWAYGPATSDDFARWWGFEASQARKLFKSLGEMIEPVDVEGWQAWALGAQLKPMAALKSPRLVRLLPQFDAYVVGVSRDCEPILAKEHKARVYRPQGWISPVVLIDGRMEGVWSHDVQRSRTVIEVEMFSTAPARLKRDLRAEGQRLGEFLGSPVELLHGQD